MGESEWEYAGGRRLVGWLVLLFRFNPLSLTHSLSHIARWLPFPPRPQFQKSSEWELQLPTWSCIIAHIVRFWFTPAPSSLVAGETAVIPYLNGRITPTSLEFDKLACRQSNCGESDRIFRGKFMRCRPPYLPGIALYNTSVPKTAGIFTCHCR